MKKKRIIIIVSVVVVLGIIIAIFAYIRQNSGERLLVRAKVAAAANKYERSLDLSERFLDDAPNDWRGYDSKGMALMHLWEYDKSRATLKKAIELSPEGNNVATQHLAETYRTPALIAMGKQLDNKRLREVIGWFETGNEILREIKPSSGEERLNIQEMIGFNLGGIAVANLRIAGNFKENAREAQMLKKTEAQKKALASAKVADDTADKAFDEATQILLVVVEHDPNRAQAAEVLMRTCINRGDNTTAAEARKFIESSKTANVAKAMLWMYDLDVAAASDSKEKLQQKLKDIAKKLDDLLQNEPENKRLNLDRAKVALELKDWESVEYHCEKVLSQNPKNYDARKYIAQKDMAVGNFSAAEEQFYTLKTDYAESADAYCLYGIAVLEMGKKDLATGAMQMALRLDPDNFTAKAYMAREYLQRGQYREAYVYARDNFKLHPTNADVIGLLAAAGVKADSQEAVAKEFDEVCKKHPNDLQLLMAVSEGFRTIGYDARSQEISEAVLKNPRAKKLGRLTLAATKTTLGDNAEAQALLMEQIRETPKNAQAHWQLGNLYLQTEQTSQGLAELRTAVNLQPEDLGYRMGLAKALFNTGMLKDALVEAKNVLENDPGNLSAGLLVDQIGIAFGSSHIRSSVTGSPSDAAGALHLGSTYLRYGKTDDCITVVAKGVRKNPDNVDLRLLLGEAYLAKGKDKLAKKDFYKAILIDPLQFSTYLREGVLLSKKLDVAQVREYLRSSPMAKLYYCDMVAGILLERSGNLTAAAKTYSSIADNTDVPNDVRNNASFQTARVFANLGDWKKAEMLFGSLEKQPGWKDRALYEKARMYRLASQTQKTDASLDQLLQIAADNKNSNLFSKVVLFYADSDSGNREKALAACRKYQQAFPKSAQPLRALAYVYALEKRYDQSEGYYRKALEVNPGNFQTMLSLSDVLNMAGEFKKSLEVLDDLEKLSDTGKQQALMAKARYYSSWGLQGQAVAALEKLAQMGRKDDPQLQLQLGFALATLGQKSDASKMLENIAPYADEYFAARILLADLAETPPEQLKILNGLATGKFDRPEVLMQKIFIYYTEGDDAKLKAALTEFTTGKFKDTPVDDIVAEEVLRIMIDVDDFSAAVQLCDNFSAGQSGGVWFVRKWLLKAFMGDDLRELKIPQSGDIGLSLCVMGMAKALLAGESAKPWADQFAKIKNKTPKDSEYQFLLGRYKFLMTLASELGEFDGDDVFTKSAAEQLVQFTQSDPKNRKAVGELLLATLMEDAGMFNLTAKSSLKTLKKNPTCQWAAMLSTFSDPLKENCVAVLKILKPADCVSAQLIKAISLEDDPAAALKIYRKICKAEPGNYDLLFAQAVTAEQCGKLSDALGLYEKIYAATKDPEAANNAAYAISQLKPKNQQQLQRAVAMVGEALKDRPDEASYLDTKAWLLYLQGKNREALQLQRLAIKTLQGSPEAHWHLGVIEKANGNIEMARWNFQAAVSAEKKLQQDDEYLAPEDKNAAAKAQEQLKKM
ncbi:MAG: tetratricopeptide repeat protein [Phycisphaerae bacterium]|nr:tetratricopeptide repeat protein [Phycisphaerae bacterium]